MWESAILQEALNRGHEVTAIVRNPEKLQGRIRSFIAERRCLQRRGSCSMVAGHDAVISAFNPGWSNPDIYNQQVKGTRAIINGVKKGRRQATAVRRAAPAAWKSSRVSSLWIFQGSRRNISRARSRRVKR